MNAELCVVVTRPEGQATALLEALIERGLAVEHLPMLRIDAFDPLPGAQRQRIIDLEQYQHVIFVSANAARLGLARIGEYWPEYPVGPEYWAVGASTAAILRDHELEPQFPSSDMSSEGLLAMPGLAQIADQKVLIVKGVGGRQMLEERLSARGARVETLECYQRDDVVHDPKACASILDRHQPQLILASSGEGLEQLTRLLRPKEHTNLSAHTVVVPSPRVADKALALGWPQVECAENASDGAMLAVVDLWRETQMREMQR